MKPLLRILALWRPQAGMLVAGAAVSLLTVAAAAGLAIQAGRAVVPALLGGAVLLWVLRGLGVGRVVFRYVERLLTHAATFRALAGLRVWFFRGLARNGLGGLGMLRSGDALARLVDDIQALDGLYIRIAIPALATVVLLPLLLWTVWPAGPLVAVLAGSALLLAAAILPAVAAHGATQAGGELAEAGAGLRVAVLDALTGLREIRAFGAQGRMLQTVQAREGALFGAQRRLASRGAIAQAGATLCGQAAVLLILLAPLPPAWLVPALLLTLAAFEAVGGMPRAGVLFGLAASAAQRVVAAADARSAVPEPSAPVSPPSGHGLRFERIVFAWPGRAPVFDGLSLDIPAGARVAILGPSGSGKSTLAALALRVVAPQSGRVLFGGRDLAGLRSADVHARIGWLSQGTTLFADTIRANLLLGRPDADDTALWRALDQAEIGGIVRALPDGLDTWLGPGGAGLSGGQGRRVALARTLLSAAPILILDEPATGLDAAAERAFLQTLNEVAEGRTVILIVHRLLGVERLDRIWRLSGGRAVAAAA
ncbi:MAG: thiol reductant ABC exporter subunit CydC [Acetobacteraceae bacterium]|nr:thiol reductant ABC exporter subunit CydC [Acetobacteraceae bacterium]